MELSKRLISFVKAQMNRVSKNTSDSNVQSVSLDERVLEFRAFVKMLDSLLQEKRYIAKSDYTAKVKVYEPVIGFFKVLQSSGVIDNYCNRNGISEEEIHNSIERG